MSCYYCSPDPCECRRADEPRVQPEAVDRIVCQRCLEEFATVREFNRHRGTRECQLHKSDGEALERQAAAQEDAKAEVREALTTKRIQFRIHAGDGSSQERPPAEAEPAPQKLGFYGNYYGNYLVSDKQLQSVKDYYRDLIEKYIAEHGVASEKLADLKANEHAVKKELAVRVQKSDGTRIDIDKSAAVYFGKPEPGNDLYCCGTEIWERLLATLLSRPTRSMCFAGS